MREKHLILAMALVFTIAIIALSLYNPDGENRITGLVVDAGDRDMANVTLVYSVAHLTRVETGYEPSEYDGLAKEAKRLVAKCRAQDDISSCISANLNESWQVISNEGTYYLFWATSSQSVKAYDEEKKKIAEMPVIYRFALDFS